MTQITVKSFAAQIGIPSDKLLQQLVAAGIHHKKSEDVLSDEEKMVLLGFLRTHHGAEGAATKKIVLKQKSTSQITQSSRFGQARTVQVEVRKKRTFVKRSEIEEPPPVEPEAEPAHGGNADQARVETAAHAREQARSIEAAAKPAAKPPAQKQAVPAAPAQTAAGESAEKAPVEIQAPPGIPESKKPSDARQPGAAPADKAKKGAKPDKR